MLDEFSDSPEPLLLGLPAPPGLVVQLLGHVPGASLGSDVRIAVVDGVLEPPLADRNHQVGRELLVQRLGLPVHPTPTPTSRF